MQLGIFTELLSSSRAASTCPNQNCEMHRHFDRCLVQLHGSLCKQKIPVPSLDAGVEDPLCLSQTAQASGCFRIVSSNSLQEL